MKFNKKIAKTDTVIIAIILFIVGLFYKRLINGFFQQDEWLSFSWYALHKDLNLVDSLKFFFAPNIGHYNPLTNLLQHYIFLIVGMNYTIFAILGILLHLMVVVILYCFVKLLFPKDKLLPFFISLIFGLLASIYQGVSWVVADISTLLATFLGIYSCYLYINYIRKNNFKYLFFSLILLIISLMFKEITIGLFMLYFTHVFSLKKNVKRLHTLFLVSTFGILYIIFRFTMFFLPNITGDRLVTSSQSVSNILYNFVTIPLKSISQTILPPDLIKYFVKEFYSLIVISPSDLTIDKLIGYSSILIGLSVILIIISIYVKLKDKNTKFVITFGLGWIIFNSFIFAISPESSGQIVVVDSRNLYFSSIGIVIVFVYLTFYLNGKNIRKSILILVSVLIINSYYLVNNLNKVINMGKNRKYILNQIVSHNNILPKKVVFFVESDSSYYGLPDYEKILPFQSGFGQTLLVSYYDLENLPNTFFENRFLWDIKSQGYKEVDGRGFGYFRDYSLLSATLKEYNLPTESVVAYSWDSKQEKLTNTTYEIRLKLKSVKK